MIKPSKWTGILWHIRLGARLAYHHRSISKSISLRQIEWYSSSQPAADATERVLTIEKLYEKLPIFTRGRTPAKIQAMDIYVFASGSISASSITATQGGNEIAFEIGQSCAGL